MAALTLVDSVPSWQGPQHRFDLGWFGSDAPVSRNEGGADDTGLVDDEGGGHGQ